MAKKLRDLPIGTLVKDTNTTIFGEPIIWKIVAKNHAGYPTGSTTLIADQSIAFQHFDTTEPENSAAKFEGWAHYVASNIRQWLNSNGEAGQWYQPQHEYDSAPYIYKDQPGFLKGFSKFFNGALLPTILTTYTSKNSEFLTTQDKIFLPSLTEVGLLTGDYKVEGQHIEYFATDADRKATITMAALQNSNGSTSNANKAQSYWLRTANYANGASETYVASNGSFGGTYQANTSMGIRPMCNIKSDIFVVPTPDENGVYTLTPRKTIYIYKVDPDTYLTTKANELLYTKNGFVLVTSDKK